MKHIWPIAVMALALAACEAPPSQEDAPFEPQYLGIETRLLEGDLVNFHVEMRGARKTRDIEDYARCAAAQYALIRGYGFAQHVRTQVEQREGLWMADAAYLISDALPKGVTNIDAEVTVAACRETNIPTV
ncbi:hypothetical protein [Primorskyibacter sp. S187A]|uniref:hypothetical protein n=1 Tax=Primorskyibacter sp. S187A TaxID=3415130 RepID=UPI003C7BA442